MNNTINKRTLQALSKRLFKKDIAALYDVSPSTVHRWFKSSKPIKTIKNYDTKSTQLRNTVLKKGIAKTYKKKKEFKIEFLEGEQSGRIDYKNKVSHIEYEFSDLINRLIKKKARELIDININNDDEETILLIKMEVLAEEGITEEIQEIWTPAALVHERLKNGKHKIRKKDLDQLLKNANKKKYSQYNIIKILKVFLVEKFFDL